ncbi:MAG: hypothetical protein WB660_25490 [Candidatus Sulfotelmatobacter sp.]
MTNAVSRLVLLASLLLVLSAMAQQPGNHTTNNNALALLLQSKGILSSAELAMINQASSPEEANARLAQLLVEKGLISQQEYTATVTPVALDNSAPAPHLSNAVLQTSNAGQSPRVPTGAPPTSTGPMIISAVAPVRVLPIDIPKQGGLIPDIHLGSGANMKIYGFFKASAIEDTASSGGPTFGSQDWPLPLLIGGDTGPTSDAQFHLKARSTRIGSQFEWVPKNSDFTITAKVEADFEGDYTDVSNRNISSVRSSQFDLRMAYMRLDHKLGGLPWFVEFGQDWSLISSSLPSLFETTGLGVAMGTLYERVPQFRTGIQFHSGDLKIQPEFAIVLPVAASSALTTDQRLRFGDRAGSESNQPGVESRLVFQFPLSHNWRGVVPAQIIFSGHHAEMNEIIPHAAQAPTSVTCTVLPCTVSLFTSATTPNLGFTTSTNILGASNCTQASGICTLEQLFPRGTQVSNPQNVWTTELQLPTPWVTFVGKFYKGDDLRFFFGGQLNDVYSNLNNLFEVGNGVSESGRAITFGCAGGAKTAVADTVTCNGNPVQSAYLQPSGGYGGFAELNFPLSRIFHANPEGHNAGWVFHIQYGTDRANAADARHGNGLARTDLDTVSLTYKMNSWVSFVNETSYIVTHVATGAQFPDGGKPFAGMLVNQAHDWRQEFGPIFTF